VARAHEAAIEGAFDGGTVVPLRLATIFTGEAAARRMLDERNVELLAALHVLEGREEWAVKVLVDPDRAAGESPDPAAAGSGTAYLMQRRDERRRKEEAGTAPPRSPTTSTGGCRSSPSPRGSPRRRTASSPATRGRWCSTAPTSSSAARTAASTPWSESWPSA
jgi:hypothetical protein